MIDVVEATIAELRAALESGEITAVELVEAYLARIDAYDGPGYRDRAERGRRAQPRRARRGGGIRCPPRRGRRARSPLDGIPYTAKDSYLVRGLTAAAGSPAFADLVAQRDAFTIERLRGAGAICLGLTNMPPMANGGMQRGVYGRAESPYNADFLTAPFGSGSSNGSGTATAASFAAFGLGEETWSSGRGAGVATTPCARTRRRAASSRSAATGRSSRRWTSSCRTPARWPTCSRCSTSSSPTTPRPAATSGARSRGSRSRPLPTCAPRRTRRSPTEAALAGRRIGVPRMYINADPTPAPTAPGIGGPTGRRIETRPSVIALWEAARRDLEAAGREVVEVDFPVVSNYEGDRPGAPTIATRGLVTPEYLRREIVDLSGVGVGRLPRRQRRSRASTGSTIVDGATIFPHPEGALPDRYDGFDDDIAEYPDWVRAHPGASPWTDMPELGGGPARARRDPPHRPRGVDGRARPRRGGLSRGGRRRPRRHGREPGIGRPRLAQRRLGRQRQPRDPPPRHPDGHGADGHDGRHRDAGRPDVRRPGLRRHALCCALAAAFEATGDRRTEPPRTPRL